MTVFSKPATVLVRGIPMMFIQKASLKINPDDKPILTLALGHAGYSDGAVTAEISCTGVIPLAGFEKDIAAYCMGHQDEEVGFKIAGVTTTVFGRFANFEVDSSTGDANTYQFSFGGSVRSRIAG